MKFIAELEEAILEEDFYKTNEVLEKIKQEENAFEYLAFVFRIMETNPELDYGMPGPVVHFMESFYRNGYEELLLKSIQNMPTSHTVWMLNRVINDPGLNNRDMYIGVLKALLDRSDIPQLVRKDIENFLKYHSIEKTVKKSWKERLFKFGVR